MKLYHRIYFNCPKFHFCNAIVTLLEIYTPQLASNVCQCRVVFLPCRHPEDMFSHDEGCGESHPNYSNDFHWFLNANRFIDEEG